VVRRRGGRDEASEMVGLAEEIGKGMSVTTTLASPTASISPLSLSVFLRRRDATLLKNSEKTPCRLRQHPDESETR
jgi:hypothetical protein